VNDIRVTLSFVERCPYLKEIFMRFCPRILEAGAKVLGMSMLRATLLMQIAVQEKQILLCPATNLGTPNFLFRTAPT
jgi:hypothetical protein